ncbi:MAG: hypothetical protein VKN13_03920 [Cyanobacteriota bacterium]|nr:hypothetical protein [Cyanobacteriota bacterium]
MVGERRWSVELMPLPKRTVATPAPLRRRWLDENGRFTSDPARALQVANPDAAVVRLQSYAALRGWKTRAIEKLRMVPAPRAA